ncbi:oxidoreductase [Glutamicibacter uratoxydans]|uniref:Oxidoreductase n=1 Tax=Glutamicibacter uratoxydans TaxID=43667 RepID=A0A4Y4DSM8_GLUUR|nr:aldo/keto reductase [Glutamicibacter uratoxydans]GED06904.1 oxidoreductase [Glutamicibacter uratoxydans]
MTTAIPTITLNNGVEMPQVGFGVFQVPNEETTAAVAEALKAGYRSIDTAAIYGNEEGVGKALAESGIARDELFITSKLWIADLGYEETLKAFDESLQRLGLDYLDLYLIHWPAPAKELYVDSWKALEKLYAEKKIRAIGVSNFQPAHLEKLIEASSIVPAINQVELHPALQNREVIAANTKHGIVTEAWSPLAQGAMLTDETILAIAEAHKATAAQVILRWHLQEGRVIIPKSVTPSRIAANLDLFGFELTSDELASIDALDRDGRTGPHPDQFNG